jgi:hypothetical protein
MKSKEKLQPIPIAKAHAQKKSCNCSRKTSLPLNNETTRIAATIGRENSLIAIAITIATEFKR